MCCSHKSFHLVSTVKTSCKTCVGVYGRDWDDSMLNHVEQTVQMENFDSQLNNCKG